ncbi:hypothetical protein [Blautia producta]
MFYAKPNLCDTDVTIKYISRYLGRPVIALKRIDSYDGSSVTMTRYYGLYSRHREKDKSLWKAVPKCKYRLMKTFNRWREDILLSFGYNPLKCTKCNHEMPFCLIFPPVFTILILLTDRRHLMDLKFLEELRQKYIQTPPEGMTAKLVKTMSDSDLLDMHEFLMEDDDLDGDEFEEGFYIDLFNHRLFALPAFCGLFFNNSTPNGELSYYTKRTLTIK